jgi:hypothetical protein
VMKPLRLDCQYTIPWEQAGSVLFSRLFTELS